MVALFNECYRTIMERSQPNTEVIAVVDDDESVRCAIHGVLNSAGLTARTFASAEDFLRSEQLSETACMILDIRMPGMSGLELQQRLQKTGWSIPIIFITACDDAKTKSQALSGGAVAFLVKPFDNDILIAKARAALET